MKMIKIKNIRRSFNQNRKGAAMILTMGVLILIMVSFMSFALLSIATHRNVELSDAIIQSRLNAEVGVSEALFILSEEWQDLNSNINFYPASDNSNVSTNNTQYSSKARVMWYSSSTDSGIEDKLATQIAGFQYVDELEFPDVNEGIPLPGWLPIFSPDDNSILGRYAFLIVDESGKIDPNGALNDDQGIIEGDEVLDGSVSNIPLTYLFSDSQNGGDIGQAFQKLGSGKGERNPNIGWLSMRHILKGNSYAKENSDEFIYGSVFPHSFVTETFIYDETDSERVTSDVLNAAVAILNAPASVSEIQYLIPWFGNNNAIDPVLTQQLAANLRDFIDEDSYATVDNPSSPTYVGVDKSLYINEIVVYMEVIRSGSDYLLRLSVIPELINMYDEDLGDNAQVDIEMVIGSDSFPTTTNTFSFNLVSDVSDGDFYTFAPQTLDINIPSGMNATNVGISINYAKMTDNGDDNKMYDYCFIDGPLNFDPYASITYDGVSLFGASVEVNDPRNNLTIEDLSVNNFDNWSVTSWASAYTGSVGLNSNYTGQNTSNINQDFEANATEPKDISTAYIPNTSLTHLWQLGAIHRRGAWQSINLQNNNIEANTGQEAAYLYSKGDAALLNQITLESDSSYVGTVNPNSPYSNVLSSVLRGIGYGGSYEDPWSSAKKLSPAEIRSIIGDRTAPADGTWLYSNGALFSDSDGDVFEHRAAIAGQVTALSDGSVVSQPDDKSREELIAKLMPLLSAKSNYFNLIVVAQDVFDHPAKGTLGVIDDNDKFLAETKILLTLKRDVHTNQFSILRYQYLND